MLISSVVMVKIGLGLLGTKENNWTTLMVSGNALSRFLVKAQTTFMLASELREARSASLTITVASLSASVMMAPPPAQQ